MRRSVGLTLGGALVALTVSMSEVRSETPKDGLVIADFIDDMISLDPAEVFEFSAAEAQAQIYDRLVTYPVAYPVAFGVVMGILWQTEILHKILGADTFTLPLPGRRPRGRC